MPPLIIVLGGFLEKKLWFDLGSQKKVWDILLGKKIEFVTVQIAEKSSFFSQ